MADIKFTIPIIGKILGYIYDFCTYKRKWNLRLFFEEQKLDNSDKFHYFCLRCVNNTTDNIRITKLYVKESYLEVAHHFLKDGILEVEYKNVGKEILQRNNLNLNTDTDLTPLDTDEKRFFINGRSERKNEMRIKARFKEKKTKIFIEYEIRDIQKSLFFSNVRLVKVVIPI